MKVRFDRGALADLAGILDYIAGRNPKAAVALRLRFEEASKLIGAFPEIASRTTRSNLRKMVIGKYLMVYEIRNAEAIIRYVRHGARKHPWEDD